MRRTVETLLVPKNRRLRYNVILSIQSLDNIPLLSGYFYVKLKLPSSAVPISSAAKPYVNEIITKTNTLSVEQEEIDESNQQLSSEEGSINMLSPKSSTISFTETFSPSDVKAPVSASKIILTTPMQLLESHCVVWNWDFTIDLRMRRNNDGIISPSRIQLIVKMKENKLSKCSERVGVVYIDLAHYAPHKISFAKILLQESRMNSTMKLSITMKQIEGSFVSKSLPGMPDLGDQNFGYTCENEDEQDFDDSSKSFDSFGRQNSVIELSIRTASKSTIPGKTPSLHSASRLSERKGMLHVPVPSLRTFSSEKRSPNSVADEIYQKVVNSIANEEISKLQQQKEESPQYDLVRKLP